jgi:hypothetical protein
MARICARAGGVGVSGTAGGAGGQVGELRGQGSRVGVGEGSGVLEQVLELAGSGRVLSSVPQEVRLGVLPPPRPVRPGGDHRLHVPPDAGARAAADISVGCRRHLRSASGRVEAVEDHA